MQKNSLITIYGKKYGKNLKKGLLGLLLAYTALIGQTGCASPVPYLPPEQVPSHISKMGISTPSHIIVVDEKKQTLTLLKNNRVHKTFAISTGRKGLGQRVNSYKTPLGLHGIIEKIGDGVPKYGIFNKRRYVGATSKQLPRSYQKKDYISTRILRLEGLQQGFNRGRDWLGRNVDSELRGIYIHGTTFEKALGSRVTKGCVHMSADDVIALFNQVPVGTLVWIN